MPSRADARRAAEWGARIVTLGALAIATWRAMHRVPARDVVTRATNRSLASSLRVATGSAHVAGIDVTLDAVPTAAERAWLRALRGAGVSIHWRGDPSSVALETSTLREPDAPVRMTTVAPARAPVAISDSVGLVDSARAHRGITIESGGIIGVVRAVANGTVATSRPAAALPPRAALVLGRAGWESKFVQSALTERGWTVRARTPAAPGIIVQDEAVAPIDTSRYSVIIALDSTAAALAPAIARFVRQGGGLVAAGSALTANAIRPLVAAQPGARLPGRILLESDSITLADLPRRPLVSPRTGAVALSREGQDLTLTALRVGLGRTIAIGYDESWRWRMLGGAGGPQRHALWWSRVAGLASPERASATRLEDPAPRAALYEALGPPESSRAREESGGSEPLPAALLLAALAALLAETASRRFRGAS